MARVEAPGNLKRGTLDTSPIKSRTMLPAKHKGCLHSTHRPPRRHLLRRALFDDDRVIEPGHSFDQSNDPLSSRLDRHDVCPPRSYNVTRFFSIRRANRCNPNYRYHQNPSMSREIYFDLKLSLSQRRGIRTIN